MCDIVAKSCYGFALARFRKTYDEELFRLLEQLGHDEDEFQKLELDMRLSSNGERLRRLSQESYENRGDDDTLTPKKAYIKVRHAFRLCSAHAAAHAVAAVMMMMLMLRAHAAAAADDDGADGDDDLCWLRVARSLPAGV